LQNELVLEDFYHYFFVSAIEWVQVLVTRFAHVLLE
jgi:hypothetical protein